MKLTSTDLRALADALDILSSLPEGVGVEGYPAQLHHQGSPVGDICPPMGDGDYLLEIPRPS